MPYEVLIASPERQAELAGPLGASLGQGLERILENEDPQIPTQEEKELLSLIDEGKEVGAAADELKDEAVLGVKPAPAAARAETAPAAPDTFAAAINYWKPSGVLGVDVSSHQGNVDWAGAWAYGSRFAYVKATEGTYYKNEFFGGQYGGAGDQGMLRGAYHFATPNTTSGAEQARFFVANGGGWSADGRTLPPLLDIEYNPYASLGNSCYNMTPTQMVNWVRDFSNTMRALTGRLPMIYSTADWWNTCTGRSTAFSDHPLHIASYSNYGAGTLAAGWSSYALWQYTSEGPVVGDWNQWPGDMNGLRTFATGSGRAPAVVVPLDKSFKVFSAGDFNGDGRADTMVRRADGTLWLHPGNGNGSFGTAVKIGSGFETYNQFIGVGDYDGDRRDDFLARHVDGSLWRYSGTGAVSATSEGYRTGVKIGDGGWETFNTIIGAGDADRNGRPDLLARKPDGTLWLYSSPGDGTHGQARQVGSGSHSSLELTAVGDFTGDGPVDIVSRSPQGELRLMVGNGTGSFTPSGFTIGTGWNIYSTIIAGRDFNADGRSDLLAVQPDQTLRFYAGTGTASEGYLRPSQSTTSFWPASSSPVATADLNSDGRRDVLTRRPDGTLWFHAGQGRASFAAARQIGSGWNIYRDITGAGDFNGDGRNDILARTPGGDLFLYAGTGTISATKEGYLPARRIGTGWNIFTDISAGSDFTGDGRPDILARHTDGSLWRYSGTGRVDNANEGYQPRTIVGLEGWAAFTDITPVGDYDRSGTADLLVRYPNGDLGLYRGSGSGFLPQEIVGTGWSIFTKLLPLGDQNNDTLTDITTATPGGTTWLYPGDGMSDEGYKYGIAAGRL